MEPLEGRLLFSRLVGIDVSEHNGSINWTSVKNTAHKDFAVIRATYGMTSDDATFLDNVNATSGAVAKGLYAGFYHYAYYSIAGHTATSEADNFFDKIKPYLNAGGKIMDPVLDVEEPLRSGWTAADLVQWVKDWGARVKSRASSELGLTVVPMIYIGASNAGNSNYISSALSQDFPLWVAQWPTTLPDPQTAEPSGTGFWQDWQLWQYSDKGSVSGISGSVDLDTMNGDTDTIQDYIIGSAGKWADGTYVKANTSSGLKAWDASTCNPNAPYNDTSVVVPNGTVGKILQGPVYGNGYMRWQIQYNNGVTGWSAEPFLDTATPAAVTTPSPTNNSIINALPTNFTWSAGTNASSYDVYRDGTKRATVTTNSWAHGTIPDGVHNWQIISKNGSLSTSGPTWTFTIDTAAPTAAYGGQNPSAGTGTFDFTVTYTDATSGIDATSIGGSDVTVTGPNNFNQAATLVSVNTPGNGSPRTATYRITAPGGTWDGADGGTYTVSQGVNQVKDVAGNWRPSGSVGTFTLDTGFAYMIGSTLHIDFDGTATPIRLATSGTDITASQFITTRTFSGVSGILITGTSAVDTLQLTSAVAPPITFNTGGGANVDLLDVQGGTQHFASDLANPTNLRVNVASGAAAVFDVTQHLRSLTLSGNALISTGGGTKVIVIKALTINDGAKIDVADHDIIVDYDPAASSPLGSWDGAEYTGLLGKIQLARNGGAWNGEGLTSSMAAATGGFTSVAAAEAQQMFNLGAGQTSQFAGETVDASAVVISYSYMGDADLDGHITSNDYFAIDSGFLGGRTGWINGDFDLNGRVDGDDYFYIDSNMVDQSGPL